MCENSIKKLKQQILHMMMFIIIMDIIVMIIFLFFLIPQILHIMVLGLADNFPPNN